MSRRFGKESSSSTFESKRRELELERKKREEIGKAQDEDSKGKKKEEYVLKEKEVQAITSVFKIYDGFGEGVIDGCQIPDALRALGLNPTMGLVEKLSGTIKPGEKQFSIDEFIPIYTGCKLDKDNGVYEDFIECLKLYDKAENGLMPLGELTHALSSLGEKLDENELDSVLRECMDPEDDEGYIAYIPFLARMCEKPVPKSIRPQ